MASLAKLNVTGQLTVTNSVSTSNVSIYPSKTNLAWHWRWYKSGSTVSLSETGFFVIIPKNESHNKSCTMANTYYSVTAAGTTVKYYGPMLTVDIRKVKASSSDHSITISGYKALSESSQSNSNAVVASYNVTSTPTVSITSYPTSYTGCGVIHVKTA